MRRPGSERPSTRTGLQTGLLGLLVLGLVVPSLPTLAAEDAGSVRVGPVRVEAPRSPRGRFLAISLAIGERPLWRSTSAAASSASWPVRLRAYTAKRHPLVFTVVSADPGAPVPRPRSRLRWAGRAGTVREQDAALASVLPDLVTDYGAGTLDDPGEPRGLAAAAAEPSLPTLRVDGRPVRCRTHLDWPPADGEHRMECGPFTVVVETSWVQPKAGR